MSKAAVIGIWILVIVTACDLGFRVWQSQLPLAEAAVRDVQTVRLDTATPIAVNVVQVDANKDQFGVEYGFLPTAPVWFTNEDGSEEFITAPVRIEGSVALDQDTEVHVVGGYLDVGIVD